MFVNTPYVAMRMVPATLGIATIPVAYLTLRALDCRATTALLATLFLTFENGLITQSRYILLDSPLVFFTALTTFLFVGFSNENKQEPFTERWWTWLVLTGLSLGAVLSCKWVGLFTVATVGACTVLQLWLLLGDLRVKPRTWARHFIARALCLIVVPLLFYMTMFELHFMILGSSGDGDSFMSSEFRQTLGRGMPDTYAGAFAFVVNGRVVDMLLRCCSWFRGDYPSSKHPGWLLALTCPQLSRWKRTCVTLLSRAIQANIPFRTTDHPLPTPRREQYVAYPQRYH